MIALRTPNVPLYRAWNSWAADRYLEMSFKPLGVTVTPIVYAASTGRTSIIGPGEKIRLGAHATDGSCIQASFTHAGTTLDWRYATANPYDLIGAWRAARLGEWGLRFWVILCLSGEEGEVWRYDETARMAWTTLGPRTVAVTAERAPLLVTGHESADALCAEYEMRGYWHLASRASAARVLALRFNLEEAPDNRFAVAVADREDLAKDKALKLVSTPVPEAAPLHEALAAVRDVMGWNTIWDNVNHRPYITCSRNWDLKKFGGFGFWLNDTATNALMVSLFDADQARECLATLLAGATPQGNLPCLLTGNDAWVDRTQTPIISFIVWLIFLRTGNRSLIELAYPVLARNNDWIRAARDGNGNGLLEFGSSDVGRGLYRGTKLAAKDESFMDNSPIHDEARWHDTSHTLDCEDVGLNCLVCLDSEMLGLMARELGLLAEAKRHEDACARQRETIATHFWDADRRIFANRLWSGVFVRSVAPTSFYPLLCGAATDEQRAHLLAHLEDPQSFGGGLGLPSVQRGDPAFHENVYWRGRIWPILNWLVWCGLERAGADDAADRLVDKGWQLFLRSWRERRLCPENYHAETGEGLDQPDTDPFYSWSALLAYLEQARVMHVSPWTGWQVRNEGGDVDFGPVTSPVGLVTVMRRDGVVTIRRGEDILFASAAPGRLPVHL